MSTKADQLGERVIVTGRAYVRIVEAADVLLDRQPVWTERLLLRLVRSRGGISSLTIVGRAFQCALLIGGQSE